MRAWFWTARRSSSPPTDSRRPSRSRARCRVARSTASTPPSSDPIGEVTGEFAFSKFRSNASLTITYTFRANGTRNQQRLFSTQFGTTESNTPGTFSVRGDTVTIQVENLSFTAAIERAGGEIQALLIGNDRYRRL